MQVSAKPNQSKLTYWTIELPENVQAEETSEGDVYRIDFYGSLSGEKWLLYTLQIGEQQLETVLGYYMEKVDARTISLATNDMYVSDCIR